MRSGKVVRNWEPCGIQVLLGQRTRAGIESISMLPSSIQSTILYYRSVAASNPTINSLLSNSLHFPFIPLPFTSILCSMCTMAWLECPLCHQRLSNPNICIYAGKKECPVYGIDSSSWPVTQTVSSFCSPEHERYFMDGE